MTTGLDSNRCTLRITARTWDGTAFYTYCGFCTLRTIQRPDPGKEWLWKIKTAFDILNQAYVKFYNPSEDLAVDEVIVKFQGRVIFRQYIPKKRNRFGIKIYKLCDKSGYTYDKRVYLGKDSRSATDDMTATHATVRHLTSRVENLGQTLYGQFLFVAQTFWRLTET